MLRHIAWFNEASVEPLPESGLTSPDAAVRRRCLIPARALENLGVECSVFGKLNDADPTEVTRHLQKLDTDIVVIGKISEPSRLLLARAAKHIGCYVIADFSYETDISKDFLKLAEVADQVVANRESAALLKKNNLPIEALIIPDCEEDKKSAGLVIATAHLWLDCFKKLKLKPPASANTNIPA